MKKNNYLITSLLFGLLFAQDEVSKSTNFFDYQISSERYLTSNNGNIMMNVNIWGQVQSPGSHLVFDGIDFASLLSIVGGPMEGANLNKVKIYRETPDDNGLLVYNINLNAFIETGDRSDFIKIKPNDTIIIPQKVSSYLLKQVGTVNTVFTLITIYLQLKSLATN